MAFHNTHYNLIDVIIAFRPDVWMRACEAVEKNHNNPKAILRDHNVVSVIEVTDLLLKDAQANEYPLNMRREQVSIFVECALWSYYSDYHTFTHKAGYKFHYTKHW